MTPLSTLLRDLMGKLLALRVMRAHVVAPDPTVPAADHSVRAALLLERQRIAALREEEWRKAARCFRLRLYSGAALFAIAASSPTGKCRVVEVEVDA